MTHQRQSLGKQGEELACRELRRRGYAILARRYRTRFGELDVIARDQGVLVFVEVKTRRSGGFGGATAAPCRFDVVGVAMAAGERPVLDVIVNAFIVS
jgi:putative endonuclease